MMSCKTTFTQSGQKCAETSIRVLHLGHIFRTIG
jgi:hypothetical protein